MTCGFSRDGQHPCGAPAVEVLVYLNERMGERPACAAHLVESARESVTVLSRLTRMTVRAAGAGDFTVHLRDPESQPRLLRPDPYRIETDAARSYGPGSHGGLTACGRAMLLDQSWTFVEPGDNDALCPACFPYAPGAYGETRR